VYDKTGYMICGDLYSNANIGTHIDECVDGAVIEEDNTNYLLKINDDINVYWLYIMYGDLKISNLDT